jgi:hypothetical protein
MQKFFFIGKTLAVIIILAISALLIFRFINLNPNTESFNLAKTDNWYLPNNLEISENSGFYDYWTNSIKPRPKV